MSKTIQESMDKMLAIISEASPESLSEEIDNTSKIWLAGVATCLGLVNRILCESSTTEKIFIRVSALRDELIVISSMYAQPVGRKAS